MPYIQYTLQYTLQSFPTMKIIIATLGWNAEIISFSFSNYQKMVNLPHRRISWHWFLLSRKFLKISWHRNRSSQENWKIAISFIFAVNKWDNKLEITIKRVTKGQCLASDGAFRDWYKGIWERPQVKRTCFLASNAAGPLLIFK